LEHVAGELGAGFHPELTKRLAEVVVDGAGADEQLRGDFLVGGTVGSEASDLCFLRLRSSRVSAPRLRGCSPVARVRGKFLCAT
jgi:hypothetical protein